MDRMKIVLLVLVTVVLCFVIIFAGLSNLARFKDGYRDAEIFPYEYGSVAKHDVVFIQPVNDVYGVWVFNYIWQVSLVCYALSLVIRQTAPNILNKKFYTCYLLALIFNFVWMFVWTKHFHALGFVLYILQAIFLHASLYFVFTSCFNYLESFPSVDEGLNMADLWLIRILVINGISFFTGWVSVTGLVDFAVVLQRDLDASQSVAAKVSLSLLLIGVLLWSVCENFICEKYTRFMFAEYVSALVAVAGMIANKNHHHDITRAYTLAVFIILVMLLVFRLGFILSKEIQRGALFIGQRESGENVKLV